MKELPDLAYWEETTQALWELWCDTTGVEAYEPGEQSSPDWRGHERLWSPFIADIDQALACVRDNRLEAHWLADHLNDVALEYTDYYELDAEMLTEGQWLELIAGIELGLAELRDQ